MARYVSIDEIDKIYRKLGCSENEIEIAHMIEDLPTVDAVEVVRCKDCKHKDFYKQRVYCYKIDRYRQVNDFCSCGAKMDGGDKA